MSRQRKFDYINHRYGTSFERGKRVRFNENNSSAFGKEGVVTNVSGAHICVRFDGNQKSMPCHPKALTIVPDQEQYIPPMAAP